MNVLITGGAGGLGLSVCKAFLDDGFDVRVFDLGNRVNQRRVRTLGASADTVWGDITQLESVRRAMDGVDAVVHLAAIIQPLTEENPELAARINVGGTQTIVDLVKEKRSTCNALHLIQGPGHAHIYNADFGAIMDLSNNLECIPG